MAVNVRRESKLMTDEAGHYKGIGRLFANHQIVSHGRGEYVRGEVYTNTLKDFFGIFK